METFKNILIIRTDRLGDVVLTTPAVKVLRESFPGAQLTMMVAKDYQDIVQGNPYLNNVIGEDRKGEHKGLWGTLKLTQILRQKKFDLAVIFHTKRRSNMMCFWAGIPRRLGYKNDKFGFLLTDPIADDRPLGTKHESQYCLDLLKPLGIDSDCTDLFVSIHPQGEVWADRLVKEYALKGKGKLVLLHPAASDPSRFWPAGRFAELMKLIEQKYHAQFVLIGHHNAHDMAQEVTRLYGRPVLNLIGKTSIKELSSLIKRSDLLISNDSGPVHVAAGLNRPVIAIFSRNQPGINIERWHPLGPLSRSLSVPPNLGFSYKKAGKTGMEEAELITPQEVLAEVDALFKLC